jgi:hypothetical protein
MDAEPQAQGLKAKFDRVRNLLLHPTAEWERIAAEKTSVRELYLGWVAPVLAAPFVCDTIGRLVNGYGSASFRVAVSPLNVISSGLFVYIFGLGAVYLIALTIDALAGQFDAKRDRMQALKVAAYSPTALAVTGLFTLLPAPLSYLNVLGLYSVFTFYRGLPILMRAPEDKAMGYAASVIATAVVLLVLVTILSQCVRMGFG